MNDLNEQLVDLLVSLDTQGLAQIAVKLAKINPEKFVLLCDDSNYKTLVVQAINKDRARNPRSKAKIHAIRALRENTPLGLKEAKVIVESIMREYSELITPIIE